MLRRFWLIGGLTLLALSFSVPQIILISRDQEIEIGKQVAAELEHEYGVWDDPEQTRRIERIGRSLVAVCEGKDMPYTFKILNERKELNAFTAPGGFIYITRALLEALESDDEIAFVLGHEIGHVTGDHIRKQLSQALVGSLVLDILTGGASRLVQIGTDIMFTLYQRGYSRQHERDADTRGVRYMKAAGYNPVAAITALRKLGSERYRGLIKWFGTHPDIPSRIQRIAQMLGVDPETLQPLPQGGKTGELLQRTAPLFFVSGEAVYRLPPDKSQPQLVWQLPHYRVEGLAVSPDGKMAWLLVRRGNSEFIHFALWREGSRKTEFTSALSASAVQSFQRSPNGQWLTALLQEGNRTFVKVWDKHGKEVALPDRTPWGKVISVQWAQDNRLLIVTERLGETQFALWEPHSTAQFVPAALPPSSTVAVGGDGKTLFALTESTLRRGRWEGERISWEAISTGVQAFAVQGDKIALVKGGKLWVREGTDARWQETILDEREGVFAELSWSPNGEWLAYTYRAKGSDLPQLWLAHVPSKQLWRIALNARMPVFAGR